MRIALISDIHANEVALKAVLKDIAQIGVDQIVFLGDIVTLGPLPCSVIQMIRDLDCACILGNHDAFMTDPDLIHTYTEIPIIVEAVAWGRNQMSKEDIDFIHTFQPCIDICHGENRLFLFHGSPRNHMENILSTTPAEELDQMFGGNTATVMAGGHTHIQMLRQHKGNLIINPGSVGLPFKEFVQGHQPAIMAHAEYAIVEMKQNFIDVSLRCVQFDQKAYRRTVENSKNPLIIR
jgi:putative phosphoesterase